MLDLSTGVAASKAAKRSSSVSPTFLLEAGIDPFGIDANGLLIAADSLGPPYSLVPVYDGGGITRSGVLLPFTR